MLYAVESGLSGLWEGLSKDSHNTDTMWQDLFLDFCVELPSLYPESFPEGSPKGPVPADAEKNFDVQHAKFLGNGQFFLNFSEAFLRNCNFLEFSTGKSVWRGKIIEFSVESGILDLSSGNFSFVKVISFNNHSNNLV